MAQPNQTVDRRQWLEARRELLREEKEFTRLRDRLTRRRRELPRTPVESDYVFDGAGGPVKLSELFEGRSQLIVYHFMFAPEWSQGCKACSLMADHYDPAVVHLNHRDTSLAAVSRAPIDKLIDFRDRMGWSFRWVSSGDNSFPRDYGVFFSDEERSGGETLYNFGTLPAMLSDLPGLSVFARDDSGAILHTYSTYARGLDIFLNVYNLLDVTPKGRDEEQIGTMAWVRHHDRYDVAGFVDPWNETAQAE